MTYIPARTAERPVRPLTDEEQAELRKRAGGKATEEALHTLETPRSGPHAREVTVLPSAKERRLLRRSRAEL